MYTVYEVTKGDKKVQMTISIMRMVSPHVLADREMSNKGWGHLNLQGRRVVYIVEELIRNVWTCEELRAI